MQHCGIRYTCGPGLAVDIDFVSYGLLAGLFIEEAACRIFALP